MIKKFILLGLLIIGATGCSQRLVDFTVISTKNIDWSAADTFQRGKSRVKGKDTVHIIIFIPTGVSNMKEAIDNAIESVPGAVALVDGVLYNKFFYIPLIYGQGGYVIEGTPLINPVLAKGEAEFESGYIVAYCDKSGKVADMKFLDRSDYDRIRKKAIPEVVKQ